LILRHDRPDADCLVDEDDWPAIVSFFGGDGAATLVAERWLLTARHTAANIPRDHRVTIGDWLQMRFDRPPGCTPLEGVCGESDSGGPALVESDGALAIAGVSSWQDHDGPLGTYGCIEHYARVSSRVGWIRAICD
jgi:hypothetical protein